MSVASAFFVLRVPLLPLDILSGWAAAPELPHAASPSELQPHLIAHVAHLRASYRALLADPIVREAIFIASPDLDGAIDTWLRDPELPRSRDVERALTRYLTRMASRPTPFGLFSSVAAGHVGAETTLAVVPHTAIYRHTRLDIDYLNQVVEALTGDRAIRPWLRYRPVDTACRIGGSWRYIETRVKDKVRTHHLVSIEDNSAVSAALERAAAGATVADLADAVRNRGVGHAEDFASALIDSRILQPDLECPVTGDRPVDALVRRLSSVPGAEPHVTALSRADAALRAIDAGPLAAGSDAYRAIADTLTALPAKVELARLFQVDASRPAGATLGPEALALLRRGGELLLELYPGDGDDEELGQVKRAWGERFEGRDVPLLEALDAEAGIGSALGSGARGSSALLEGLTFPATTMPTTVWAERDACLLSLIVRAASAGRLEVELGDAELKVLRSKTPRPAPPAFAVNATLAGGPGQPLQVLVQGTTGAPTARLAGRFCHLDPALDAGVRRVIAAEEALEPDAVHAEIVHLPEGRAGNVILRPVLREYEITAMGASGADVSRQLPLSDLTVRLDGGTFIVRSSRLGTRIVPQLTTAHNFEGWGVGAYRFLCLLQAERNRGSAWWSWGALAASPFLPRVRVGNVVLSRAAWRLSKAEILALQKPDLASRWTAMQHLRDVRRWPRWVVLADGDNELVVDLGNALAVDSLVQLLKERDEATLVEWYPGNEGAVARGDDGVYASQVVVPFVSAPAPSTSAPPKTVARTAGRQRRPLTQRSSLPGGEWVFAKAYGGSATADQLLLEVIGSTSRALVAKGQIDRWFFIRYADPGEHLRWRLHVSPGISPGTVRRQVERALAAAVERQLAWRVAFDTYEREIERYGGPEAVLLAERWFHADSDAAVDILRELDAAGGPDDRWMATLLSIDHLLDDLGLEPDAKARAMREARERFGLEFKVDAVFRRALADRLRPVGKRLESLLTTGPERGSVLASVSAALERRSRQSRRTLASLHRLASQGRSSESVYDLAFSYVHMAVNRMIRSEPRMHELVLYDFLCQLYARRLMREARGGSRE